MLKPILAVKDTKLGLYDPPFTVRAVGEAVREWEIITKNPETKFGKHPSDFELYQIGNFNEELGTITSLDNPTHIASGIQHAN